mmetsp:Transcript_20271/g.62668  ORF Transcript_20271/g.62668 Transcript_20271/m.62668 type:complete len:204 (-) Transcript_20271:626-1237(-)
MGNARKREVPKPGLKSVDEVLAEEELVPVTVLVDGLCFGPHFARCLGEATEPLAKEQQVRVPLWLAERLQEKNLVRVETPPMFGRHVRESLEAGATVVDLRAMSPYYYTVGKRVARLTEDDDLRKCLRAALAGDRFEKIVDWSQNADDDTDVDDLVEKLTEEERELFYAGYYAQRDAAAFQTRPRVPKLTTNAVFAKAALRVD